jgi:hypothetical protein
MPKCPVCEGEGGWKGEWLFDGCWEPDVQCSYCRGSGRVSVWRWLYNWLGEHEPEWLIDLRYRYWLTREEKANE